MVVSEISEKIAAPELVIVVFIIFLFANFKPEKWINMFCKPRKQILLILPYDGDSKTLLPDFFKSIIF